MKKLMSIMASLLAIATVNLFSMYGEGMVSREHAEEIARKEEERRLQQEREWQERRDRQEEADHEQRKGIVYDIRRRKDLQGRD